MKSYLIKRIDPRRPEPVGQLCEDICFRDFKRVEPWGVDEHDIVVAQFVIGELDHANFACARFEFVPNVDFHARCRTNKLPNVHRKLMSSVFLVPHCAFSSSCWAYHAGNLD